MPRRYALASVAVGIVLLIVALLLSAIQQTRAAAQRMQCVSNFCWAATSLHRHADAHHNSLPAGTIPNPHLPPAQRLSWWVSLLPFVESQSVYGQFDFARGASDAVNAKAINNRFRYLVCPSSGEYYDHNSGGRWRSDTPLTHYVGVSGVGADAAELPLGHPRAGAFGYDRSAKIPDDFPDGISNTLLIVETSREPGHWAFGGPFTLRGFGQEESQFAGPGRAFGGFHPGLPTPFAVRTHYCIVAMADGSNRYLTNATSAEVVRALATANGKEPVPADW